MDDFLRGVAALGFVAIILLIIAAGPIFTIWSLNTLFGLNIPINFSTWVAVNWLAFVLRGSLSLKRE